MMLPTPNSNTLARVLGMFRSLFHSSRHKHTTASTAPERCSRQPYLERYICLGDLRARLGHRMPLALVKLVARDVLNVLRDSSRRGVIHGDINQQSIVLSARDLNWVIARFKDDDTSSGMGGETVSSNSSDERFPTIFRLATVDRAPDVSLCVRSPETIIQAPCDSSTDIWSLGCVLYALLSEEPLFDPYFQCMDLGLSPDESHVIQMIELLGDFPREFIAHGVESSKWFGPDGALLMDTNLYPVRLEDVLRSHISETFTSLDVEETVDFLSCMIKLVPRERANVRKLSRHCWLQSL